MAKRIKILFTIPNFDTAGSGKVVYDLIKHLDKEAFAPEICCFHSRGAYFKTIESLGVPIHIFDFAISYKPFASFPFRLFKIVRFFRKHKFDLIHSWHWSSDFSEPLAAKLAGIPFVYTKKAMGWGNKAWRWRSKLSSKIIAINQDMIPDFFSNMSDKIAQIPLGVDINHFKPLKKTHELTNELSFLETDFIIVSVVNLAPVKGIEVLLEAVNTLNDDAIKVVIVGANDNDYGRSLIENYKQNKQIHFIGKVLDVRPYLALANVFVIPTKDEGRKEGMPIAPLEAMAASRIVLGSNISGIKDVLKQRPDLLFKPNDVASLASAIRTIRNLTESQRSNLERELRIIVEKHFTINDFVANHESFYKTLLE